MKKFMMVIFVLIFICILSYSPVWAEGWGNTTWGMSISEVEKATNGKLIPCIERKDYSHKLQDKISIDKYNLEVLLNFSSNKLDKVLLKTASDDSYSAYLFLLDEIKKKYGNPSDGPKKERTSFLLTEAAEWVTKDTIIGLSNDIMLLKDKTIKTTIIIYRPRQSASSGKL